MELVDLYDENRLPLGKTAERRTKREPGEYRTVVHVCIFNSEGQLLIQQRSEEKIIWPGKWDVSAAGAVDAGENSRQAAEREAEEELGYALDLTGVRPTVTVNYDGGFDDYYIAERDLDISALKLQAEEVTAVRWATCEEVLALTAAGTFVSYPASFLEFLFDMRGTFGFLEK